MRRQDREVTDKKKMMEIIKKGKYAVIALCSDNDPYIVTLNYGFDELTNTFYFHGADKGQKIDLIKANPNASLMIIEDLGYQYGHCSHAYRSVVCRGKMTLIDHPEERVHGIEVMIHQLEPRPEGQLARIRDTDVIWRRTQIFKLAVESMTGKERPEIE
ncbi:MAG: pyridoxamine 5'-phosphate oxidase family protein [Deltaproteobacteria bacterium]|nr:pyridoxamine 5'-phosphate oxidase family protein [Deltaproteobacteria bacterium]